MMTTFLNLSIFIRDTMTIGTPRMTRPSSIMDTSMATYEAIWSPQAPLTFMFHWAQRTPYETDLELRGDTMKYRRPGQRVKGDRPRTTNCRYGRRKEVTCRDSDQGVVERPQRFANYNRLRRISTGNRTSASVTYLCN
jgi:hypothetical protein